MPSMNDLEKAMGQIMLTFGIVRDADLISYIEALHVDFPNEEVPRSLADLFRRLNVPLKALGLQIRSLITQEHVGELEEENEQAGASQEGVLPGDRIIRVVYHGIVNLEGDGVAEKFGTNLRSEEILFLKECIETLVHNKYQSMHDLVYGSTHAANCRSGWKADMEVLVNKLIDDRWLQRTERAYIELGPRSHLELRSLIEATALHACEGEDEDEQARQELLGQLPQILFY